MSLLVEVVGVGGLPGRVDGGGREMGGGIYFDGGGGGCLRRGGY